MSDRPFRTVLIGAGKIGLGYAEDDVMARHYHYATHAQALLDHPRFAWEAVVDPSPAAVDAARERWGVVHAFHDVGELAGAYEPEVAVLATPPSAREGILDRLPSLRGLLVEKPIGTSAEHGRRFANACGAAGVVTQVNFWRRGDERLRELSDGALAELIGSPQALSCVYGNGLLNNGAHMVDLTRMLFGDVATAQAVAGAQAFEEGPIVGDVNLPFVLVFANGLSASFQPVRFEHYRENGLDIWGTRGRLGIWQEGLWIAVHPRRPNRAMSGESEVASDEPTPLESTVGEALLAMYTNLAAALDRDEPLWSPLSSALETQRVLDGVIRSAASGGTAVSLEQVAARSG